jgi:MerR family transcriptional regulator, light-induced transcriptional regulator
VNEGPELPEGSMDDSVNLKQAAAILGVHYMTVYRYVRQGRLPALREGTEWRISSRAIASFSATTSPTSTSVSSEVGSDTQWSWGLRIESCLLASDETAAWSVIEMALAAGHDPAFCYLDMIAAALSSIGERWSAGEIGIAEQHLATAVAIRLVARLGARFRRPGRSRGTVVFGAPRGELHILPIAIVADLVRLQGYDVLELGADVPAEAFVASAVRTPRLICVGIGITRPELLGAAQEVVDAVRVVDSKVPIVIGGLAIKELRQTTLRGVTAVTDDGRDAIAIIESFAQRRAIRRVV